MVKEKRTRLEKLQRSWRKASADERNEFLAWLGAELAPAGRPPDEAGRGMRARAPITTGRYLTTEAIADIRHILQARQITLTELAGELGLPDQARPLALALLRSASLKLSTVAALEIWLARQD